jgi:hypothetical protein
MTHDLCGVLWEYSICREFAIRAGTGRVGGKFESRHENVSRPVGMSRTGTPEALASRANGGIRRSLSGASKIY